MDNVPTAPVTASRLAMATRFEIVLHGAEQPRLLAAAEAALEEIERAERRLSLYRPDSEVSRINARASDGPVRVEPGLFRLLQRARTLWQQTGGAFDVTIAPLLSAWGFIGGSGHEADPGELEKAREASGFGHVVLDEASFTVCFDRPGVKIDLGAIGKGWTMDRAAEALHDCGVTSALLHGGTSSVVAIGAPPGEQGWAIDLAAPAGSGDGPLLARVLLRDSTLSVSAAHGKSFLLNGIEMGHVLDPRTGAPATGASTTAVLCPSAAEGDALSTALLVLGPDGIDLLSGMFPEHSFLAAWKDGGKLRIRTHGPAWEAAG